MCRQRADMVLIVQSMFGRMFLSEVLFVPSQREISDVLQSFYRHSRQPLIPGTPFGVRYRLKLVYQRQTIALLVCSGDAGRFLCEKYHPKPHDNSHISRCEAEANKLKKKVEAIKDTIAAHDDSLFSDRTGKLQTGLTCHHKFNSDTLHLISTGIQDNIAQLIEDLESALKKNTRPPILLVPKPTYQNPGERRKTKGKQEKGNLWLWKIERVELLLFFFHWEGHQLTVNMSQRSMECHRSIMLI